MLFLSMIITAFAAILALSPSSFAEPIPVRNTQLAERDAIAERETIAVGQEIAKAQFLAEREAKPEIEALEGRQINVEQFCCQDVACTICDGTLCETRDCVWWVSLLFLTPFPNCYSYTDSCMFRTIHCAAPLHSRVSVTMMDPSCSITSVAS